MYGGECGKVRWGVGIGEGAYCSLFSWNRNRLIRIRTVITKYQIKINRYLLCF